MWRTSLHIDASPVRHSDRPFHKQDFIWPQLPHNGSDLRRCFFRYILRIELKSHSGFVGIWKVSKNWHRTTGWVRKSSTPRWVVFGRENNKRVLGEGGNPCYRWPLWFFQKTMSCQSNSIHFSAYLPRCFPPSRIAKSARMCLRLPSHRQEDLFLFLVSSTDIALLWGLCWHHLRKPRTRQSRWSPFPMRAARQNEAIWFALLSCLRRCIMSRHSSLIWNSLRWEAKGNEKLEGRTARFRAL